MKKKIPKMLGVVLTVVLVASLFGFAAPVSAETLPVINDWDEFDQPVVGALGGWFWDEDITDIGPMAKAIDGTLYTYVQIPADAPYDHKILKSTDDGRSWSESTVTTLRYGGSVTGGVMVVDMVCSSLDADTIYVTDGNYIYKSIDAGTTFARVAEESLEKALMGDCGIAIVNFPITCLDVGYDANDDPILFIGVTFTGVPGPPPSATGPPSVLFIEEEEFPSNWVDLDLNCWPTTPGGYTPYSIGCAPDFATSKKTYVVVSGPSTSIMTLPFTPGISNSVTLTAGTCGATFTYTTLPCAVLASDPSGPLPPVPVGPVTLTPGQTANFWTTPIAAPGCGGTVTITLTSGSLSMAVTNSATVSHTSLGHTHVVYTTGSVCGWYSVAELVWDCIAANNFGITAASRIAFPDDYADTLTLFVGVVASGACGGDVYSVTPGPPPCYAIDRNVVPGLGGCVGGHTNIISLDICGSTEEGSLIAGQYDLNRVYCSSDGGWTWGSSILKDPTGSDTTYVLWIGACGASALAATSGCECAVSLSCGETVCKYWNQISLIATAADCKLDIDHSPGYITESETLFMVTECVDCCHGGTYSVFRYDGTYWERVFCTTTYAAKFIGADAIEWVAVSPDFNTTGAVFVANTSFDIFRSLDAGCSWSRLAYPCEDIDICSWIVIDMETIVIGADTKVYKTTRHGARPWDVYTVTGAGTVVSLDAVNGDSFLLGDDLSQVFISDDGAVTWSQVGAAITVAKWTWVAFDPDYTTNNTIYGAAGAVIARCVIDPDLAMSLQTWSQINAAEPLHEAWGIQAVGDTTLYVGDCGYPAGVEMDVTVSGTIAVKCAADGPWSGDLVLTDKVVDVISGPFEDGEIVSIIEYNLVCEFLEWELVEETETTCTWLCNGQIVGEIGIQGVQSGATGMITISPDQYGITVEGYECHCCRVEIDKEPVTKGSFETGTLAGWTVGGLLGAAEVLQAGNFTPNTITPVDGNYFCLLSTGPGSNPAWAGDIDLDGTWQEADTTTLSQTFIVEVPPAVLSFAFTFLTGEEDQANQFDDIFMVTLNGVTIVSGSVFGLTTSPFPDVPNDDDLMYTVTSIGPTNGAIFDNGRCNWLVQLWPINAAGTYTLEFLVADQANHVVDSGLLIDNVCLDGQPIVHYPCAFPPPDPGLRAIEVVSSFLTVDAPPAPAPGVLAGIVRSVNATAVAPEFERIPNAHFGCCLPAHCGSKAGLLVTAGVNGCPDSNVVWALGTDGGCCDEIWFYEDTLATPVILTLPADAATLVTTTSAILEWEALCAATEYEIYVSYICIGCPEEVRLVDECFACAVVPACVGCSEETCCYILGDLDPGTTYYWKVRVCEDSPTLSKWSDKWEFTTSLGAVQEFCSPPCGAQDIILTPNFSWDAVAGATSYEIQLSSDEDFTTIVASGTSTVNAWACDTTLDYDTTYYWRVRPVKDGVYGAWLLCLFTTEAAPEEPPAKVYTCGTCGLEFATEDELWDHWEAVHEPAPVETPWYIWVIIGIGAVLLIFVIVLIWRTRRAV